ncbi:hypothetical protein ACOMHN_051776 [Nucella lapillus]
METVFSVEGDRYWLSIPFPLVPNPVGSLHPLGLCNANDYEELYDYGWVGVVKLERPELEPQPCLSVFGKVKRALQRGATAVILDITDNPVAAQRLSEVRDTLGRPVVVVRGADAAQLMGVVNTRTEARVRIIHTPRDPLHHTHSQMTESEYLGIFVAVFLLFCLLYVFVVIKVKWRHRERQLSMTNLAKQMIARLDTRLYQRSQSATSTRPNTRGARAPRHAPPHALKGRPAPPAFSDDSAGQSSIHSESCAICLEQYRERQHLRVLPCRHEFHRRCVDPWLEARGTCPLCKVHIAVGPNDDDPQRPWSLGEAYSRGKAVWRRSTCPSCECTAGSSSSPSEVTPLCFHETSSPSFPAVCTFSCTRGACPEQRHAARLSSTAAPLPFLPSPWRVHASSMPPPWDCSDVTRYFTGSRDVSEYVTSQRGGSGAGRKRSLCREGVRGGWGGGGGCPGVTRPVPLSSCGAAPYHPHHHHHHHHHRRAPFTTTTTTPGGRVVVSGCRDVSCGCLRRAVHPATPGLAVRLKHPPWVGGGGGGGGRARQGESPRQDKRGWLRTLSVTAVRGSGSSSSDPSPSPPSDSSSSSVDGEERNCGCRTRLIPLLPPANPSLLHSTCDSADPDNSHLGSREWQGRRMKEAGGRRERRRKKESSSSSAPHALLAAKSSSCPTQRNACPRAILGETLKSVLTPGRRDTAVHVHQAPGVRHVRVQGRGVKDDDSAMCDACSPQGLAQDVQCASCLHGITLLPGLESESSERFVSSAPFQPQHGAGKKPLRFLPASSARARRSPRGSMVSTRCADLQGHICLPRRHSPRFQSGPRTSLLLLLQATRCSTPGFTQEALLLQAVPAGYGRR